jgi:hypothetical protein
VGVREHPSRASALLQQPGFLRRIYAWGRGSYAVNIRVGEEYVPSFY